MSDESVGGSPWICPVCGEENRWGMAFCEGGFVRHPTVFLSNLYAAALARESETNHRVRILQERLSERMDEDERLALAQEEEAHHMMSD